MTDLSPNPEWRPAKPRVSQPAPKTGCKHPSSWTYWNSGGRWCKCGQKIGPPRPTVDY